jgi:hypothetical protein
MKASGSVLCLALLLCAACAPPARTFFPETIRPATATTLSTTAIPALTKPVPSPSVTPRPTRTCTPTPRMSPRPAPFSIAIQAAAVWSWEPNNYLETLAVTDGLVLLGVMTQVVILDTSDLRQPQRLWQSKDLGRVQALALAGRWAYIVAGENLLLWDVGNPKRPRELSRIMIVTSSRVHIIPTGATVHLVTGKTGEACVMRTIDLSDPAAPREQKSIGLARFPNDLALLGDHGYALDDGYLEILDLTTTPTATSLATFSVTANINSQIQIVGDRAYIATNDGLWILDVGDPAAPREVGHYPSDIGVTSAEVVGTRAYLTCQLCGWEPDENGEPQGGCGQGVYVMDLENTDQPQVLGSYGLTIGQNQVWIEQAQLVGHTLYLLTDQDLYAADLGPLP